MRKASFIVFGIIFAFIGISLWVAYSHAMSFCYNIVAISTYCIVKQSTYGAWAWISMFLATGCFICAGIQGKAEKKEKAFRKHMIERLG